LAALPQFTPLHAKVTVDGQTIEDEFLLVEITNCRLYAGLLPFNPGATLDDGYYEVRLFRGSTVPQTFAYVVTLLRHQPLPADKVITLKGQSVVVETKLDRGCHTDGEQAGFTPLISEIRKHALRLLVPDSAPSDLFLESGDPFT
jgi:diacylglycerol kinase (ATP)